MSGLTTPSRRSRDDTLEPLDVSLLPPFHQAIPTPSDVAPCDSPVEETPTTATASLPTPGPPATIPQIFAESDPSAFPYSSWDDVQFDPPPAPMLKDMDTFTEGTAVGSFDSLRSSWSSENFPERPSNPSPPTPEIESWRTNVLMSLESMPASSFPSTSASRSPFDVDSDDEEGDDCDHPIGISYQHSLDPASWQATPTRAPKRQLSYNSVDGEHRRGRKLVRHSTPIFSSRSCNQSVVQQSLLDDCDDLDHSVDRPRSSRSASAPNS